MRIALSSTASVGRLGAIAVLLALGACEPAPGPFRPRPPRSAPCVNLPAVSPRLPTEPVPIVDLDLNRDGQADFIAPVAGSCDEYLNCDHDLYWVRESCALYMGRVRAQELDIERGQLVTREVFLYEGERGARETWWSIGMPRYRYEISAPPRCQLPSYPESHRCDGQPDEEPAQEPGQEGMEGGEGAEGGDGAGGEGAEGEVRDEP